MKKKRFNEAQIIQILQEHEAGLSMPELSRKHSKTSALPRDFLKYS